MKKINVEVTQNCIRRGESTCVNCPIARAMRKYLKKGYVAWVGGMGGISIKKGEDLFSKTLYDIPSNRNRSRFVSKFDTGKKSDVNPFNFSVKLPEEFIRPCYLNK